MGIKRYLAEVFDANFNRLVTPPTVSILYIFGLSVVTGLCGLFAAAALYVTFRSIEPPIAALAPVLILTLAGGMFFLGAFVWRLVCEFLIVAYRIGENTTALVRLAEREAGLERVVDAAPARGGESVAAPVMAEEGAVATPA